MSSLTTDRLKGAFLVAIIISLLLIVMQQANLFKSTELSSTNIYFTSKQTSNNIVIVALDDASLGRYGRSPASWSRIIYTDLIDTLTPAEPRVIAFDLLFSEASENDSDFAHAIQAAHEARIRIILAQAGVGAPLPPLTTSSFQQALRYDDVLRPIPNLAEFADYIGFVNTLPDNDGFIRRQPSIVYDGENLSLSFTLATYLAYLRVPAMASEQVLIQDTNQLIAPGERELQVDDNGFWQQNFFGPAISPVQQTFQTISLVDVVDGKIDLSIFKDKVILVGLATIAGDADRYPVPSELTGGQMAGIEIQANALETLISDSIVKPLSPLSQTLTILGLSLITSFLCTVPRWFWKLMIAAAILLVAVLSALLIFNTVRIITPLLYPAAAIILTTLAHIGLDTNREIQLRRRADFLLETVSELTEQNMDMKTILPHIAKNLQILLPGSSGAIYVQTDNNNHLECQYYWPDLISLKPFDNIVNTIKNEENLMNWDIYLGIPIWWQSQLLAVVVVSHALAQRRLPVLQDFANKLAPIIYGTMLYEEINKQRNTLSAVLSNTPSVVLVLDEQQRVQLYSEQATKLVKGTELQDKSLVTIFNSLQLDSDVQTKILSLMQREEFFQETITLGDKTYDLEAAFITTLDRWVLALNDVTDLVELSKLKTRMIRMASHDLKNPLGRITGYIQLIKSMGYADEKLLKFLHPIEKSADEMGQLIGDLLNLERTRSGRQEMERFSLREVVEQVVSRHAPDALQKNQTYESDLTTRPLHMLGDLRLLSQVVSNLIGNAIKYTPEGGNIDIRLQSDKNEIRFEVKDTGYGISEEAQENLFTEFYRVRTKETANIGGTGLGLSLVKSVIEAHKGTVGVLSEENVGSTFYFVLPNQEGILNA